MSTSLLTPPSTSHRSRDAPKRTRGSRVAWSQQNQYHHISQSPLKGRIASSSTRHRPARSILKEVEHELPSVVVEEPCREDTPQPEDPLANPYYLERPLSIILSSEVTLRDLVDAYTQLTARLRMSMTEFTDGDSSWALFNPLRQHRDEFAQALSRDLGRALENPSSSSPSSLSTSVCASVAQTSLPSPKASPTKKRHGLTEQEVKHARDCFSTSQAALRFLLFALAVPTVYSLFSDKHLNDLLTDILAIPLAPELPTPNARKTHSTAIWVLQAQRLPEHILQPASSRIAYALQRGLDGELGKEGKKGSISDGLKAVHDLSLYQPATFIPAFSKILPSILGNLLAPTLPLRLQACQALGGYAYVLAVGGSYTAEHLEASSCIADFLVPHLEGDSASSSSPPPSPSKGSLIVRTLRQTLSAQEPSHPAHGPQWACSVLSAMIVLLGSRVYSDRIVQHTVTSLARLTIKHRRSSIRALGCLLWRSFVWVWFQPPLPFVDEDAPSPDDMDEDENPDVDEEDTKARAAEYDALVADAREKFSGVVDAVSDMGTAAMVVAGYLGDMTNVRDDGEVFHNAMDVLAAMIGKKGLVYNQASEVLQQLLSPWSLPPDFLEEATEARTNAGAWEVGRILPRALFSGMPGILTTEVAQLAHVVRNILNESASVDDIRWLTPEELATDWVFERLLSVWKGLIVSFEWPRNNEVDSLFRLWHALFAPAVEHLQENDASDEEIARLSAAATHVIVELIQDPTFGFNTVTDDPKATSTVISASEPWSCLTIKYYTVDRLWMTLREIFPKAELKTGAEDILAALTSNYGGLDEDSQALTYWARACATTLELCDYVDLDSFCTSVRNYRGRGYSLGGTKERLAVWRQMAEVYYQADDVALDEVVLLLGSLFTYSVGTNVDSDDTRLWEMLFQRAVTFTEEINDERAFLLNSIAKAVPKSCFTLPIVDMLLSKMEDVEEMREAPSMLLTRIDEQLSASYASPDNEHIPAMWVLRSLTQLISFCPKTLLLDIFEHLEDGLSLWIADDEAQLVESDYASDVVPLYQTILLEARSLPATLPTLESLSPILQAPFTGDKHDKSILADSFKDFWNDSFAGLSYPLADLPAGVQHCLSTISEVAVAAPSPSESQDVAEVEAVLSTPTRHTSTEATYVPLLSPVAVETGMVDVDDEEPLSFPDSDTDDDMDLPPSPPLPLRPTTPVQLPSAFKFCALPQSASHRRLSDATETVISTPQTSPSRMSIFADPPPSSTPSTPSHAYTSPSRSSRTKTVRVYDKENLSPAGIASVMQRLAAQATTPSKLGKRGSHEDSLHDGDDRPMKRLRMDQPIIVNMVHASPNHDLPVLTKLDTTPKAQPSSSSLQLPQPLQSMSRLLFSAKKSSDSEDDWSDSDSTPTKPKPKAIKRKRDVFDCVELPSLSMIRARQSSPEPERQPQPTKRRLSAESQAPKVKAPAKVKGTVSASISHMSLRKTQSERIVKMPVSEFVTPKRPRRNTLNRCSSATLVNSEESEDPIPALFSTPLVMVPFGSDDSIMQDDDENVEHEHDVSLPSSDDNPHLGHVTPRALISPSMRRVFEYDTEPGSDDSVGSPSRDVARRRGHQAKAA